VAVGVWTTDTLRDDVLLNRRDIRTLGTPRPVCDPPGGGQRQGVWRRLPGGRDLSQTNIITNKNLTPDDTPADWDTPGGIRLGTIEVTRLGMKEAEMVQIADFIHRVLVEKETVSKVARDIVDFRQGFQKVHYCFD